MPKKFIIKDDEGKQFEITETAADEEVEESTEEKAEPIKDDEGLTPEEVAALKQLAARSSELIALLEPKHDAEEKEEETADSEEEVESNDSEEVIETKPTDSKKSVGSLEAKDSKIIDSVEDREIAIADAWSARFKKSYNKGE